MYTIYIGNRRLSKNTLVVIDGSTYLLLHGLLAEISFRVMSIETLSLAYYSLRAPRCSINTV